MALLSALHGGAGREGGTSRATAQGSWRHLSDGTPYPTTGPTEFAEMDGSSLLSEQLRIFNLTFLTLHVEVFSLIPPPVTGVFLAAIKLAALLGYTRALASLLTLDT